VRPVENEFAVITKVFEGILRELHDDPHGITVLVGLGPSAPGTN